MIEKFIIKTVKKIIEYLIREETKKELRR